MPAGIRGRRTTKWASSRYSVSSATSSAITQTAAPNDAGANRPPNPPFIRSGHLIAPGFSDHRIYWEEYGTLAGEPVMVMHGGPGAGSYSSATRFFDPQRYRVILFD